MHGVVCTRDRQLTRQPPHATVISCTQRAGYRPHLIATCALSIASVITRRGRHLANRSVGGTDDYLDYHGVRSLNKQPLKACLQAGLKRVFGQILSRGRAVVDLFAMLVSHAYIARRSRSTVARFINEESWTARLVVGFSRSRSIRRRGEEYIYIFLFKYFR